MVRLLAGLALIVSLSAAACEPVATHPPNERGTVRDKYLRILPWDTEWLLLIDPDNGEQWYWAEVTQFQWSTCQPYPQPFHRWTPGERCLH